jgi:hypothetical protein
MQQTENWVELENQSDGQQPLELPAEVREELLSSIDESAIEQRVAQQIMKLENSYPFKPAPPKKVFHKKIGVNYLCKNRADNMTMREKRKLGLVEPKPIQSERRLMRRPDYYFGDDDGDEDAFKLFMSHF